MDFILATLSHNQMKICSRNKRKQISIPGSYTYHRLNTKKSCNIYSNPYYSNSGIQDDHRTTITREDDQVTMIPGDGQLTQQARK